jgi:hypothetical protein
VSRQNRTINPLIGTLEPGTTDPIRVIPLVTCMAQKREPQLELCGDLGLARTGYDGRDHMKSSCGCGKAKDLDALSCGYDELLIEKARGVPFQWFVTIAYARWISPKDLAQRIVDYLRRLERTFRPTIGAVGIVSENTGVSAHGHFLVYSPVLTDKAHLLNGMPQVNSFFQQTAMAKHLWKAMNKKLAKPERNASIKVDPRFIHKTDRSAKVHNWQGGEDEKDTPEWEDFANERSIVIKPVFDVLGAVKYMAAPKNIGYGVDGLYQEIIYKEQFLRQTRQRHAPAADCQGSSETPAWLEDLFRQIREAADPQEIVRRFLLPK